MKVEGIVLAAGLSSRVGTNKLILDVYGKTVIEQCILGMYDICSSIIAVGGHRISDIEHILYKYSKVKLVYNEDYLSGMFSSIKKGIANIRKDRFFLIPGDYPLINSKTYKDMMAIDKDIIIPVYNGKRGHPLLMKSYLIDEILRNSYYETLRDFISVKESTFINIDDPGILIDIDTMEDYNRINQLHMVGD